MDIFFSGISFCGIAGGRAPKEDPSMVSEPSLLHLNGGT